MIRFFFLITLAACAFSHHPVQASALGGASSSAHLMAVIDVPGPIAVETVVSTSWRVPRSGVINLKNPKAAGLVEGDEPIQIFFHVLRHPRYGAFIIDTGVERAYRDAPKTAAFRGLVASYMHFDRMGLEEPLGDWLAKQDAPLAGVFLTHLHMDHVSGLPDVPKGTPIYAGPGETTEIELANLFLQPNIDRTLAGHVAISEWGYARDPDGRFAGVVDVFGDGSLWAIWTPGHTPGSTAYLARTPQGPVLFTGDTCHTVWGWNHDVEPGTYTENPGQNADSLRRLRELVAEHPAIDVRLGHQSLASHP